MTLQHIELGQILSHYIVYGRGDGTLAVKPGHRIGVGVIIYLIFVDFLIADIAVTVAGFHDDGVVGNFLVGILLGKGGEHIGILLHHIDMRGQAFVFAQQIFDDLIFLICLHHPVDGHILLKVIHHHFCVTGDGVELAGADVIFG